MWQDSLHYTSCTVALWHETIGLNHAQHIDFDISFV